MRKPLTGSRDFERAVNRELKKLYVQRAMIDYRIAISKRKLFKLEKAITK